jgi:hypothetical protein
MTSRRSSLRASLPSLGGSSARACSFAPVTRKRTVAGLDFVTRWSNRDSADQAAGSPTFLSNPMAPSPCSMTPDGLAASGHYDPPARSPLRTTAKTPIDRFLSRLNHTALVLAIYASQDGSPHHHARLASGCRPSSTGRDCLPTGSLRKVSDHVVLYLVLLLPQASWRTSGGPGWPSTQGSHRPVRAGLPHTVPPLRVRGRGDPSLFREHVPKVRCPCRVSLRTVRNGRPLSVFPSLRRVASGVASPTSTVL